jgi:two-component system sensor histidine kinase ChiS
MFHMLSPVSLRSPGFVQSVLARPAASLRTALVVEDDPSLRRAMAKHLAGLGFHVLLAAHYANAVAHLEASTIDLACIDLQLPTESGYELCERIRGPLGLESLPILVTSHFRSPEELAYAEAAGANVLLVKPFSMSELGANIAMLMSGAPQAAASLFAPLPSRAPSLRAPRTMPDLSRNAASPPAVA